MIMYKLIKLKFNINIKHNNSNNINSNINNINNSNNCIK